MKKLLKSILSITLSLTMIFTIAFFDGSNLLNFVANANEKSNSENTVFIECRIEDQRLILTINYFATVYVNESKSVDITIDFDKDVLQYAPDFGSAGFEYSSWLLNDMLNGNALLAYNTSNPGQVAMSFYANCPADETEVLSLALNIIDNTKDFTDITYYGKIGTSTYSNFGEEMEISLKSADCLHTDDDCDHFCDNCGKDVAIKKGVLNNDAIEWKFYEDGTLILSGSGDMDDYFLYGAPWYAYNSENNFNSDIKKVIIGDGITSIGNYAFTECSNLESVFLSDSVTSIGGSSFSNCTSLTQINLSNNLSEIGPGAFEKCEKLLNIVFPQTLKSIGSAAFYNCSALSSIVFPNNLQSIGQDAFHGCSNIEGEINIPATVKEIGSIAYRNVFDDCYKITAINVDKNNTAYKSENGVLFSKDGKTLFVYPAGKTQTSYEIPSSVETVGYDAFSNNHFVKAVKIPESVKLIDSCAFMNCTSLCDIEIPITVEELGGDIFVGCENLDSLKFLSICCHIPYGKSTLGLKEGTTVYGYNNSSIEIFIKDYIIRDYGEEYYKFVSLGDYDGEVFTITSGDINENVAYRLDCTGKLTISGTGNISESFEFPSENSNNVLYLVIEEGIAENNNSFSVLYNLQSATFAKSVTKTVGLVLFRIKKLIFLNADVEIFGLNYCNPTIYGYNDSTAEAYADKYGCTFVELKEIHSHSYTSSITKNATCKESGVTTFTCSCGDTYSEEIAKLTTHIWGNWTVTSAATYEATGTEKRTCTVCEKTESRTIAKLEYKDIVLINTEEMKVFGDDNVISVDGKTVNDLLKNINGNVSITNKDGKIVSGEDIITSGMTVTLKDENGKVLDSKTVVVLGDNNGDGKITANDARTALRASVALDKLNSWQTAASNVEKMAESKITAADARLILRASVGLEDLSVQLKTIR